MSELGKVLKEQRETKNLNIKTISENTKIPANSILLLENGEFEMFSSYTHLLGFVKIYSEFLDLDFDEIKELFHKECNDINFHTINKSKIVIGKNRLHVSKKIILFVIFIIVVALICTGLGIWYTKIFNNSEILPADNYTRNDNSTIPQLDNETLPGDGSTITSDNKSKVEKEKNHTIGKIKKDVDLIADIAPIYSPLEVAKKLKKETLTYAEKQNVIFRFNDTCWIHINIDNETELDFIAEKGTDKTIGFKNFFVVDIGNASAITIINQDQSITGLGGWRTPIRGLKFTLDDKKRLHSTKIY